MFKFLTLKTKIIIFIIFALIGTGMLVQTAVENRRVEAKLRAEFEQKLKEEQEAKQKKAEEERKRAEEEKKKQEEQRLLEEKKKALEEKNDAAKGLFHSKNYTEAIKLADEIIKEDPLNFAAYNIKGITLCYQGVATGRTAHFEEGMKNIDKSLEIKNDYGYARFNKALAYELYGHYNESLYWYDEALKVENYVWSHYGKASIYGRRGDVANTVKYLKIAIEMKPEVKEEAAKEADFNSVRNSKEFQELIKN